MNKNRKILRWVKIRQDLFTQPLHLFRNNVFFSQTKNIKRCVYTHWMTWTKNFHRTVLIWLLPSLKRSEMDQKNYSKSRSSKNLKSNQQHTIKQCCGTGNLNRYFLPEQNRNWNCDKTEHKKFCSHSVKLCIWFPSFKIFFIPILQ